MPKNPFLPSKPKDTGNFKNPEGQSKGILDDYKTGKVMIAQEYHGVHKIASISVENPTATEDITIFFTDKAITIKEMRAVLLGSASPSVNWTIRQNATDRSAGGTEVVTGGTSTTSITSGSDVVTFNDATIPADSFVWLKTTAKSGTVTELHVSIVFKED